MIPKVLTLPRVYLRVAILVASITDALIGSAARRLGYVSNIGVFLDPIQKP